MSYKVDPLRCAYCGTLGAAVALKLSAVSLYNNDNLGRVFAVHDIGRGPDTNNVSGFSVLRGQFGINPVNASPVVTGQGQPTGICTDATNTPTDTLTLWNGNGNTTPQWNHDFPLIVLQAGWRLTAWGATINTAVHFGFWYQILQMSELMGMEPQPTLVIPKVVKLTVETE